MQQRYTETIDAPRLGISFLFFLPPSERLLRLQRIRLFHSNASSTTRSLLSLALLLLLLPLCPPSNNRRGEKEDESRSGKAGFLETLLAAFNSDSNSSSRNGDVQAYYSSSAGPIASVSSASPATGGVCDCCGATLKVVGLDSPARARVRSALIRLGAEAAYSMPAPPPPPQPRARQSSRLDSAFAGGEDRAGKNQGGEQRQAGGAMGDLEQFAAWLEERRREVS